MSRIVDETPIDEVETDGTVVNDDSLSVDVLVCGLCHKGFHFVEEFQEHKQKPGSCKKISAYRIQNTKVENKSPDTYGFLLWKNSIAKNKESQKMYKLWCCLPERVKDSWMQAAKIINTNDELAKSIPNKVSIRIKEYAWRTK
ncbi:uncharacterized protein LOC114129093 [Aphis gossypii]|uniref:uncharacterized protein LOC114129093 n=1 Tax=Aphis gossypii TaxID=80765 RepID=UPI0021595546|nr:uncharacterized protein LOC114129093 [Aphis gossypii]